MKDESYCDLRCRVFVRWFQIRTGWKRIWTERLPMWIVRHAMPKGLRHWTVVFAAVGAAGNDRNPMEVTAHDMMKYTDPMVYPPGPPATAETSC